VANRIQLADEAIRSMYLDEYLSAAQIAEKAGCSAQGINHRLKNMGVVKRSISDASYARHNPNGDPFEFTPPESAEDWQLFGLGLGLYWGEGTKADPYSVKLGNTDPRLLQMFMKFMSQFFTVHPEKIKVQVQIFGDLDSETVLDFWKNTLSLSCEHFTKVVCSQVRGSGSYRFKSRYGVATVMYHNARLRQLLGAKLEEYAGQFGVFGENREIIRMKPGILHKSL
jgi:hypothetical protein